MTGPNETLGSPWAPLAIRPCDCRVRPDPLTLDAQKRGQIHGGVEDDRRDVDFQRVGDVVRETDAAFRQVTRAEVAAKSGRP
jgi:hypothetical protein